MLFYSRLFNTTYKNSVIRNLDHTSIHAMTHSFNNKKAALQIGHIIRLNDGCKFQQCRLVLGVIHNLQCDRSGKSTWKMCMLGMLVTPEIWDGILQQIKYDTQLKCRILFYRSSNGNQFNFWHNKYKFSYYQPIDWPTKWLIVAYTQIRINTESMLTSSGREQR